MQIKTLNYVSIKDPSISLHLSSGLRMVVLSHSKLQYALTPHPEDVWYLLNSCKQITFK